MGGAGQIPGILPGDSVNETIYYTTAPFGQPTTITWTFPPPPPPPPLAPEPGYLVLLATGLLAMAVVKRKRGGGWNFAKPLERSSD